MNGLVGSPLLVVGLGPGPLAACPPLNPELQQGVEQKRRCEGVSHAKCLYDAVIV